MSWALLSLVLTQASSGETFVFNAGSGPAWCWPRGTERPAEGYKVLANGGWRIFPMAVECGPGGADVAQEPKSQHERGHESCPIVDAMKRLAERHRREGGEK